MNLNRFLTKYTNKNTYNSFPLKCKNATKSIANDGTRK